jgi:hypothetical protein
MYREKRFLKNPIVGSKQDGGSLSDTTSPSLHKSERKPQAHGCKGMWAS